MKLLFSGTWHRAVWQNCTDFSKYFPTSITGLPEDEGCKFLWNVRTLLPEDTASHPRNRHRPTVFWFTRYVFNVYIFCNVLRVWRKFGGWDGVGEGLAARRLASRILCFVYAAVRLKLFTFSISLLICVFHYTIYISLLSMAFSSKCFPFNPCSSVERSANFPLSAASRPTLRITQPSIR